MSYVFGWQRRQELINIFQFDSRNEDEAMQYLFDEWDYTFIKVDEDLF